MARLVARALVVSILENLPDLEPMHAGSGVYPKSPRQPRYYDFCMLSSAFGDTTKENLVTFYPCKTSLQLDGHCNSKCPDLSRANNHHCSDTIRTATQLSKVLPKIFTDYDHASSHSCQVAGDD